MPNADEAYSYIDAFKKKYHFSEKLAPGDKLSKYHTSSQINKFCDVLQISRPTDKNIENITLYEIIDQKLGHTAAISERLRQSESVVLGRFCDGTHYVFHSATQANFDFPEKRNKPIIFIMGRCETEIIANEIYRRLGGKVDVLHFFSHLYLKKINLNAPAIDLMLLELGPINSTQTKRTNKFHSIIVPHLPPISKIISFSVIDSSTGRYKPLPSDYVFNGINAKKDKKDGHVTRTTMINIFERLIDDVVSMFENNYDFLNKKWNQNNE